MDLMNKKGNRYYLPVIMIYLLTYFPQLIPVKLPQTYFWQGFATE